MENPDKHFLDQIKDALGRADQLFLVFHVPDEGTYSAAHGQAGALAKLLASSMEENPDTANIVNLAMMFHIFGGEQTDGKA